MQKRISHSLEETAQIAEDWLLDVSNAQKDVTHPRSKALVVGLSGHLGAGKTAFVKAVAKALRIEESVTSPTFVIMKMYDCRSIQWKKLIHIDLYRLEKKEEMVALKLEEVIGDKDNLIMIEWPENVGFKVDMQIDFRALEEAGVYEILLEV